MSENTQIVRKCKDCPKGTQAVCHHAFGAYWCIKSEDGEGCAHPLDGVAEAWRKAGWTPGNGKSVPITLPVDEEKPIVQASFALTAGLPPLSESDY